MGFGRAFKNNSPQKSRRKRRGHGSVAHFAGYFKIRDAVPSTESAGYFQTSATDETRSVHRYLPGSRTTISVVALSTAALLNGNARGATLRQSSS